MIQNFKGISASEGYSIGTAYIKHEIDVKVEKKTIHDVESELNRFDIAVSASKSQLEKIKDKAEKEVGADKAAVFESHMMLLDDPEFTGAVKMSIEGNKVNAESALEEVQNMFLAIFESMDDEYMRERAADVRDVAKRILNNLLNNNSDFEITEENTIVIAHDLTPSDTAMLDKSKVIAFITNIGGRTSHSAIMARSLEIPAVVGMQDITTKVKNGDKIIVDGTNGLVIVNPNEEIIKEYTEKKEVFLKEKNELKKLKDIVIKTSEGKHIEVCGNIGSPEDIAKVLENGGDGIGLYRTEFLYMHNDKLPTEEEQFEAYKVVVEKMSGKPVVIRTLDIGGDKKLPYLPLPEEMNPFLGYRAIRLCLDKVEIFKTQLRALLRASIYGNLKIMFPMIQSLDEFLQAKGVLKECMNELEKEGKSFNKDLEVGMMVEIPASALIAEELAKHVDFFSIGTNDLTQYTLAADRMNEKISYIYDSMHPAVLRLIKMTIDAAHKEGKWCGMCGEMAGDSKAVKLLVEYGLDEFSMSASSILKAKKLILEELNK